MRSGRKWLHLTPKLLNMYTRDYNKDNDEKEVSRNKRGRRSGT